MRFSFWHTKLDSIEWTFDRFPQLGEELTLGEGIYRVIALRPRRGWPIDAQYDVKRVRDSTLEEQKDAFRRGVRVLPEL